MGTRKTTIQTRTEPAAPVADWGSEMRLNLHNLDVFHLGLVLDKGLQLVETPVAYPIVHSPAPSIFSYASEVFQDNLVSVEVGNDVLAYFMINPCHEPLLPAGNFPKRSPGRLCAFGLKNRTQMLKLSLGLLDSCGIIEPPITSDSKVVYPEVNAKSPVLKGRSFSINILGEREQEETPAAPVHLQQAFLDIPTKILAVTGRNSEWHFDPALDSGEAQDVILETCGTGEIIPDGSIVNDWFIFGSFDNLATLLYASNSKLGRKLLSKTLIHERMQLNIILNPASPSSIHTELQTLFINSKSPYYLKTSANLNLSSNKHRKNTKTKNYINLARTLVLSSGNTNKTEEGQTTQQTAGYQTQTEE